MLVLGLRFGMQKMVNATSSDGVVINVKQRFQRRSFSGRQRHKGLGWTPDESDEAQCKEEAAPGGIWSITAV
jgi:hypothetical protein